MAKVSYEVQKRYRDKALRRVVIDLPKSQAEEWEKALKADGKTKTGFVKDAINKYLNERAGS